MVSLRECSYQISNDWLFGGLKGNHGSFPRRLPDCPEDGPTVRLSLPDLLPGGYSSSGRRWHKLCRERSICLGSDPGKQIDGTRSVSRRSTARDPCFVHRSRRAPLPRAPGTSLWCPCGGRAGHGGSGEVLAVRTAPDVLLVLRPQSEVS